ncbi:RND family efflux transporter MFP subunit (plasmid) [Scytonema sp. HK-05]|uniref:efflux RND transporter periplasmic adaptor subunit n=1 Tax=Scytonema sp. HK-05 TaxID=1137095 RepID=UPI00093742C7|nr:efflux RND transporter periplasmic adaptor subunit [Scytonema sp. HK-05]OKH53635.1 efflux transporter periplasmic adaptor subunit [Scytonema sp. HK-05]BAY50056.1 RND family efflux transporter MFP subunit [Scytonema sp. HK-05]
MLKVNILLTTKLLGTAFLASVLTSACTKGNNPTATATAVTPPPLATKVQTVESNQIERSSEFVGTLEAQERVSLQPQVQGRIDKIFVSSGKRVERGTAILSLSLDQTQAEVASAVAATKSTVAARATAAEQLQVAEADRASVVADVKLQQAQFERTQQLVREGAQARQQLDIAQKNLDTAIANFQAASKRVNAAKTAISQAEANVRQAEANTAAARVNLNYKQLLAPINGEIGDFLVKVGDYVNVGQTLTTITKNESIDMRISVPSNYSSQLRLGLPTELIDANTGKRLVMGSVNFISARVDTGAQSILSKARFPNRDGSLRDGQYVRARIVWNTRNGVLIPTIAVTRIGGQNFVFVAQKDTKGGKSRQVVHQRPVKLGDIQGGSYQVIEGIKAGEQIAVSNILKLRDGTLIQPQS